MHSIPNTIPPQIVHYEKAQPHILTCSDFHIGFKQADPEAWSLLTNLLHQKPYDLLVIGGDMGDFVKASAEEVATTISDIRQKLETVFVDHSDLHIHFNIGNHDVVQPMMALLTDIQTQYPERFTIADILLVDDTIFTHGDLNIQSQPSHQIMPVEGIQKQFSKRRDNGERSALRPMMRLSEKEHLIPYFRTISEHLKQYLDPQDYSEAKNIVVGHKHFPFEVIEHEHTSQHGDSKHISITGCAVAGLPNIILDIDTRHKTHGRSAVKVLHRAITPTPNQPKFSNAVAHWASRIGASRETPEAENPFEPDISLTR